MSMFDAKRILDEIVKDFDTPSLQEANVTVVRGVPEEGAWQISLDDLKALLKNTSFHEMQSVSENVKPIGEVK